MTPNKEVYIRDPGIINIAVEALFSRNTRVCWHITIQNGAFRQNALWLVGRYYSFTRKLSISDGSGIEEKGLRITFYV